MASGAHQSLKPLPQEIEAMERTAEALAETLECDANLMKATLRFYPAVLKRGLKALVRTAEVLKKRHSVEQILR